MRLAVPQALLLLLPLGLLLWKTGRLPGPPTWLRFALLFLLVGALAQPQLVREGGGTDVVVLVDRSRSMPPGSETRAAEVLRLLESQRRPGDRLGVLSFGRQPRVDLRLDEQAGFGGFRAAVDPEASELSRALDAVGELLPPDRGARVLVLSDGRATGEDPRGAARRLAARGVAVDHRWLGREEAKRDVAVTGLDVPAAVEVDEPFQLTATVNASEPVEAMVSLRRGGKLLVKGKRSLAAGDNLLTFRDLIDVPGLATYQLAVEAAGDGVVENDVGQAVLRVEGPPRVLLVSSVGAQGTLARALAGAGLPLEVRPPSALSLDALDGVGALVLENVEAGALSEAGLSVVAQYVREAGGGLVMTGGRRSFGEGGYRKSPVEDVLPVSLEIREEQRRATVALSVIMDCSCSMGATVPDGRTKMELAAEGVVGALQLLNERDEASVHMVDTESHEIFSLRPVSDGLPLDKVARGFSGGGGIFVGEGLRTGMREILSSSKATRHVLLFSDAADSEEPDDYLKTLERLRAEQVTVSVIGLGTPNDSDAALLDEVARRGGGRIYFAEDARSLPRIFSQETIAVAKAGFVDEPTSLSLGPDLALLGKLPVATAPKVGGYNLTYLKPKASVGLRSEDENRSPVLALWPRGAGRVVAFAAEVDGQFTGELRQWAGSRALLEQMVRWTMGRGAAPLDAVVRSARKGSELHVTVDFDPRHPPAEPTATLVLLTGDGKPPVELPMRWEEEDRLGVRYTLEGTGTFHPVVKLGERVLRAPPISLPYSPEHEPSRPGAGRALLAELSKLTGGEERVGLTGLFEAAAGSREPVGLSPALVALAVLVLLAEVTVRRLLSGRVRRLPAPRPAQVPRPRAATAPAPVPPPAPEEPAPPQKPALQSALARAKERARQRLKR